ncbi:hypothetical protein CRE_17626 [Caenorhabditis remanei]|uniref:Uncharacterized protein n=2 Tax=Caenorhabditis remanei TaxID=31234 RepID=E3NIR6_CAERE|nr:hypothetical protein CRE_17626 [Caenorhabditis remanei]
MMEIAIDLMKKYDGKMIKWDDTELSSNPDTNISTLSNDDSVIAIYAVSVREDNWNLSYQFVMKTISIDSIIPAEDFTEEKTLIEIKAHEGFFLLNRSSFSIACYRYSYAFQMLFYCMYNCHNVHSYCTILFHFPIILFVQFVFFIITFPAFFMLIHSDLDSYSTVNVVHSDAYLQCEKPPTIRRLLSSRTNYSDPNNLGACETADTCRCNYRFHKFFKPHMHQDILITQRIDNTTKMEFRIRRVTTVTMSCISIIFQVILYMIEFVCNTF